jgi:hypothetical protein
MIYPLFSLSIRFSKIKKLQPPATHRTPLLLRNEEETDIRSEKVATEKDEEKKILNLLITT